MVTLPSLDGVASPKTFATALFNQWQIGPSYPNNGVLVLVVPGARRIEVEIGSGLNRMFRVDNWLPGMLQRSVVPAMKSGDIGAGTSAAVEACARRLVETNTAVLLQARFRRTVLDPNVLYPLLSSAAMTLITRATLVADRNKQCHSCKARFAWGWDRSVLNGLKWNVTEPGGYLHDIPQLLPSHPQPSYPQLSLYSTVLLHEATNSLSLLHFAPRFHHRFSDRLQVWHERKGV